MTNSEKPVKQKDWKTSITSNKEGEILVRGYNIDSLIGNLTFAQTAFLVLKGELPNEKEAKMMDAILVSCVDAGIAPPSVVAARTVFSGGNPLNAAVAAGVLTLGDAHGGAIEQCAKMGSVCASFSVECYGTQEYRFSPEDFNERLCIWS